MRLSCDAVITCSHSRQHATCHKQSDGVSACGRPASQDSAMVSSGGSGFAWQMATVSLAQQLRINWLIDFSSINSIVSACCCCCSCCSSCCCCLLSHSHSLSVPTSTRQIYALPAALSTLNCPQQIFCCHDKLLSCLACHDQPRPPPSLPPLWPCLLPSPTLGKLRRRARYTKRAYDKQFVFIAWP